MKIYVVIKYTDVETFGMCGDTEYVTETELVEAYGTKQDANFECKYLNSLRSGSEDNILYDVQELELI